MPTYKAPGVYIDETKLLARPIELQDAGATVFIGMTTWGPADTAPWLLTTLNDFERLYGPCLDLRMGGAASPNYVAYAARAFFANGGARLHIVRVIGAGATAARWTSSDGLVSLTARTPGGALIDGGAGNFRAIFAIVRTPLTRKLALRQPVGTLIETGGISCVIEEDSTGSPLVALADDAVLTRVSLGITIAAPGQTVNMYEDLAFDARHPRAVHMLLGNDDPSGEGLVQIAIDPAVAAASLRDMLEAAAEIVLTGGSDGDAPPPADEWAAALDRVRALDDIAFVAAPGSSSFPGETPHVTAAALVALAAEGMGRGFAVLDPPPALAPDQVLSLVQPYDTKDAALFYPWLLTPGAGGGPSVPVPPSGFVCGIYSRSDRERGIWKLPANDAVQCATGLVVTLTSRQQELLAPEGINRIREFPDRGIRLWGARTLSSDPEWKYISQRRYVRLLTHSIEAGIAWAVFEPNGSALWAALATSIANFLTLQWQNGALSGAKPEEAFFVRCDRTTMSQTDLDQGRAVILIGLALVKPAEFNILRIITATGALAP